MIAVDETPSTGPYGLQDPVPLGVGDAVAAENSRARGGRVSEGKYYAVCENFTLIGFWKRWGGTGLCSSAQGDPAEVRGLTGGGNLEKRDRPAAERAMPVQVAPSVLGWWWSGGWGTRIFRLHGGHQRGHDSALCPAPG